MNDTIIINGYGALIEPATFKIERLLPASVERIWSYLVDSDLRRKWLASGDLPLKAGAPFEFVWRNEELSSPPGQRPEGFPEEHSMKAEVVDVEAPNRLVITWGTASEVTFELSPQGQETLLTIIHRRLSDRGSILNVSAGWHMHLNVLDARVSGREPDAFWNGWKRLKAEYEQRLPA
ncbi:MAG: SRPBCC family protein [Rhizobiaceae bacterium]|nr:SRPBCC family protein [Rhizobiaceae bacterium]